jgi:hypothetical protein
MTIDIERIEALFMEGKTDEAQALLATMLKEELSEEERGALLVAAAEVYTRAMTEANNRYAAKIEEALNTLRTINVASASLADAEKTAALRTELV